MVVSGSLFVSAIVPAIIHLSYPAPGKVRVQANVPVAISGCVIPSTLPIDIICDVPNNWVQIVQEAL